MNDILVRFDDATRDGNAFTLSKPKAQFIARRPEEVVGVLRASERAAEGGAWVAGFLAYEAAAAFDQSAAVTHWPDDHPLANLPLAWFTAFGDRSEATPLDPPGGGDIRGRWELDFARGSHEAAVARIQRGIFAGDFYQLNLTARLRGTVADPLGLYAHLCTAQKGAYHAFVDTGEHVIASASPELFFLREGRTITVRPMKGTAPRGRWAGEDTQRALDLKASEKERAENVMIVDLLRNDLAKIATVGSVRVPALWQVERYPTILQLTSTVTADVRDDVDLVGIMSALFPSGSITGAPKRAAMNAIAALEGRPRGVYCGAIGYLEPGPNPTARFSVAIRTVTSVPSGYAEYGTGGGITAGSSSWSEWQELLNKTAVLEAVADPAALLETFRFSPPDTFVNLERHLDRLEASADYFGLHFDRKSLVTVLHAAVEHRLDAARIRLRLDRDGASVTVDNLPSILDPVTLALADGLVDSRDRMLYHKQADRSRYDRFRASARGVDDVILVNERGQVTETTTANLAVRLSGQWWTPPLACGLLPGVERARLLAEGVLSERRMDVSDLLGSEDLAVLNSLRGWRPARLHPSTE